MGGATVDWPQAGGSEKKLAARNRASMKWFSLWTVLPWVRARGCHPTSPRPMPAPAVQVWNTALRVLWLDEVPQSSRLGTRGDA